MIKKITLFLLLCQLKNFSQTSPVVFCPPGATWHYDLKEPSFLGYIRYDGVLEYKYKGDTIINNKVCKKIIGSFNGKYQTIMNTSSFIPVFQVYYFHLSNNVLYTFNNNNFDTVVDYNAKIGDQWRRFEFCENTSKKVTVTDTGHIIINGQSLKKIKLSSVTSFTPFQSTSTQTVMENVEYIERVLNISGAKTGLYLFHTFCDYVEVVDKTYPYTSFRCYSDNSFPLYNPGNIQCHETTGLNTSVKDAEACYFFPNPAHTIISFKNTSGKDYTIKIIDISGKETFSGKVYAGEKMEISALEPGIYFVNFFEDQTLRSLQKLIMQ